MPRLLALVAVLALTGAGCAGSRPAPDADARTGAAPLPDTVRIALGETAPLGSLAVRFDLVTEDSRCPLNVTCIRAGEARVRLLVEGDPVDLVVLPGDSNGPKSAVVDGVRIEATSLVPVPGGPGGSPVVELAATASE